MRYTARTQQRDVGLSDPSALLLGTTLAGVMRAEMFIRNNLYLGELTHSRVSATPEHVY